MNRRSGRASAATTIDGYLAAAALDDAKRAALEKLRAQIHAAAPGAEECISYGLPAMRHGGRMLLWFGAGANHCALYPGAIVGQFTHELARFETSKGTIRFQPGHPLPAALVRRIVEACVARNAARGGARSGAKTSAATAPRNRTTAARPAAKRATAKRAPAKRASTRRS